MKKMLCIHAIVHGKVQGVFYRDGTRQQAETLGITGWVRNNKDDTVELHACGTEENVHSLIEWLKQGPPRAGAIKVDWREITAENHRGFVILR